MNTSIAVIETPPAQPDRALDSNESMKALRAWDADRITALADAYRKLQRHRTEPSPTWEVALEALESFADALEVTEGASAERACVAATLAHVGLAGLAAGIRERLRPGRATL